MMEWWRKLTARRAGQARNRSARSRVPSAREPVFSPKGPVLQVRKTKVPVAQGFRVTERPAADEVAAQTLRATLILLLLTAMFAGIGARLIWVGLLPPSEPRASIRAMPVEALRRGNIYDRNGVLLAATLKTYSLYADPKRVMDPGEVAEKLPVIFPKLNSMKLLADLSDPDRRFLWLARRLTPHQAAQVMQLGLPGVQLREEYVRIYPHGALAGHVLGAVDVDNNGLAGVERGENARLQTGEDVHLALDVRVQALLRARLQAAQATSGSKAAWGVVMLAPTREIVAMVSLPEFDPNHFGKATADARFNRAVLGSYEMGSTFKLFTMAQGLADGHITPLTKIDCRTPITIGKYTIKDYHAKKAVMTATEVLRYSSNIGAAKIADLGGPDAQQAFLRKLGLLDQLPVGVSEVGPVRYPANWGRVQTFTISFGHGLMVTPIHMVNAVAALADGVYKLPSVLKGGISQTGVPILSDQVKLQVHDLMRDVVLSGSGRSAQVVGYDIGGKTGTAEKIGAAGGYDHSRNVVSFVGVLPLDKPQYVTLVMLDEPMKGFETGGRIAAPTVGQFYNDLTQMLAVPPDMAEVAKLQAKVARQKTPPTDQQKLWYLSEIRQQQALEVARRQGVDDGEPTKPAD
jgi:cell division protein FtsI (penicillin-binding protein 3)